MNTANICAEVLAVLLALGPEYMSKVPRSIVDYLADNCDKDSMPNIDTNKPIEEQGISKESKAFIAMLKIQYWCKSEEEKEKLMMKLLKKQ